MINVDRIRKELGQADRLSRIHALSALLLPEQIGINLGAGHLVASLCDFVAGLFAHPPPLGIVESHLLTLLETRFGVTSEFDMDRVVWHLACRNTVGAQLACNAIDHLADLD